MAWESQDDGFIAKILLQEGAKDIPVGTPAMIFVEEEVWAIRPPIPLPSVPCMLLFVHVPRLTGSIGICHES